MKKLNKHSKKKLGLRNKKNASRRIYYSQFVTLFYIRNTNITLERDATEILRMLKELQQLTNRSRLIFSTYCSLSQHNLWQSVLEDISNNIKYIRIQFEYILENIIKKIKSIQFYSGSKTILIRMNWQPIIENLFSWQVRFYRKKKDYHGGQVSVTFMRKFFLYSLLLPGCAGLN